MSERMTVHKRAEKLVTQFNREGACLSNTDETFLQELVAKALDQACAEAVEEIGRRLRGQCYTKAAEGDLKAAYAKGYSDAREAAANVAEKRAVHNLALEYDAGWNRCANLVEDEIRALQPSPEREGKRE